MLQTQFRLKHFCSVLHLFVYRFEVWCYPKHYNQCKRGVEPLGTLLRNTLFSLQVPFVKQVAVYLKYVFFNCHFICCTVFRALLVTARGFAMVGLSKHKSSILHKSSIEELPLNFAVSPHYRKTLVVRSPLFFQLFSMWNWFDNYLVIR